MIMELVINESQALLQIRAVSDFELETLSRVKRNFSVMIPHLTVEERDYYDTGRPPKSAVISIDFLNPPPTKDEVTP